MKWYAERELFNNAVAIWASEQRAGEVYVSEHSEITFRKLEDADKGALREPWVRIPMEHAENMFQAMWDAGIRPAGEHVSDKTYSALKDHIKFAESVVDRVLTPPRTPTPGGDRDG